MAGWDPRFDPLTMVQITEVNERFVYRHDIPALMKFERPLAYGWTSVVFPNIHSQNSVLELWHNEVSEWLKTRGIKKVFSSYAHCKEKKKEQIISPVFFFKDELDAALMMWRFKGEFA